MSKVILIIIVTLVVLGTVGVAGAYASDSAVPGDALYSLDLYSEGVVRNFISDEVALSEYEMEILDERVAELEEMEEVETVTGQESEFLEDALDNITAQEDRVRQRIDQVEGVYNGGEVGEAVMEQVQNMWQEKVESHEQRIEQVQSKVEASRGEASGKFDEVRGQMSESGRNAQSSLDMLRGNGNN